MNDRNICLEPVDRRAAEDQEAEIIERKGIGHPDSTSNGVAESVFRALSNPYLDRVGKVLHYNTDETQLVADAAAPAFGGDEIIEPIYLLIVDRVTKEYGGEKVPVDSTALRAARKYPNENTLGFGVGIDIIVDVKLDEDSGDLQDVFGEETRQVPTASDTNFGVGHALLTETERVVFEAECAPSGPVHDDDHPELEQNTKFMGKREGDIIGMIVAAAMVDKHLDDIDDYVVAVDDVRRLVSDLIADYADRRASVGVNIADDYNEGSIYLMTTDTSAEQGDDGSVGCNNRASGLITSNRPMSVEATSGKSPANRIGKIHSPLSTHIAETVVGEADGIHDLQVRLLSQIGRSIDEPHVASTKVTAGDGVTIADIRDEVIAVIDRELANVTDIIRRTIEGELGAF